MITIKSHGSFNNIESFLRSMQKRDLFSKLESLAQEGVNALAAATPVDSGATSAAWSYEISIQGSTSSITWLNSNIVDGTSVAVMLQYGHGTGTGGYVQGRDFINPAMKPIFDRIANQVWEAVTSA